MMPGYGAPPAEDGAVLLDEVHRFLGRFVAFPTPEALDAVTLWVVHTHLVEHFESTPRLALLSPEPGSGKTRTLEVLELLVYRAMAVLNASAPALFRTLQAETVTVLLDEVDSIFGRHGKDDPAEDLRAMLNAGHRRGATIPRCVGPRHDVEQFPVFAAVALAGLGDLPDTLMSRSVIVRMRRRAPGERVEPFRRRLHAGQGEALAERLAVWAEAVGDQVRDAWPELPAGITDRPADVWEPLLAVADAAGGDWPARARVAAVALCAVAASREASLGVRLLGDVRTAFEEEDRLATEELLRRLHALDEAPWGDLRGRPLDARGLARRLGQYDIRSRVIRVGDSTPRGYMREDLHDAWQRYLTPSPPAGSATSATNATPSVDGPVSVADRPPDVADTGPDVADGWPLDLASVSVNGSPVAPVADVAPPRGGETAAAEDFYAAFDRAGPATVCRDCGDPLDPAAAAGGFTTHPGCGS